MDVSIDSSRLINVPHSGSDRANSKFQRPARLTSALRRAPSGTFLSLIRPAPLYCSPRRSLPTSTRGLAFMVMIQRFDINGDGVLSFEEFRNMML